jgi:glycosyltransferase involved in cell wall biosynthesis
VPPSSDGGKWAPANCLPHADRNAARGGNCDWRTCFIAGAWLVTVIGYLVPEFPGQTHAFFRREVECLRSLGLQVEFVSTRRPPKGIACHSWGREAEAQTTYLFPPYQQMAAGLLEMLRGALQWPRVLRAVSRVQGVSLTNRVRILALAAAGAQLSAIGRQRGWRHLHVHSCGDSAFVALFAHLLGGLPYSLTLHGPLEDYGAGQAEKWRNARFGIVITKKLRSQVESELAGNVPAIVEIAPMGVDVQYLQRSAPYSPWRPEQQLKIFSCGRLNPVKGHQVLIEAVSRLISNNVNILLEIAGDDEVGGQGFGQVLRDRVADAGLQEHIVLLGAISEELVRAKLDSAHIFVLASFHEPLGVAIMEAMAMQVPVITTNAGGVPELIDDGETGILVPPRDVDALASAILRLSNDPQLALTLAAAGRRTVVERFSSRRSAEVIARLVGRARLQPSECPIAERGHGVR